MRATVSRLVGERDRVGAAGLGAGPAEDHAVLGIGHHQLDVALPALEDPVRAELVALHAEVALVVVDGGSPGDLAAGHPHEGVLSHPRHRPPSTPIARSAAATFSTASSVVMSRMSSGTMSFLTSMPSAAKASRNILFCMLGAQAAMTSGPLRLEEVGQEAVAVLLTELGMDHPELHRQLDAHAVDEVPDVHLLESRALAGADAHDQTGALHRSSESSSCSLVARGAACRRARREDRRPRPPRPQPPRRRRLA